MTAPHGPAKLGGMKRTDPGHSVYIQLRDRDGHLYTAHSALDHLDHPGKDHRGLHEEAFFDTGDRVERLLVLVSETYG